HLQVHVEHVGRIRHPLEDVQVLSLEGAVENLLRLPGGLGGVDRAEPRHKSLLIKVDASISSGPYVVGANTSLRARRNPCARPDGGDLHPNFVSLRFLDARPQDEMESTPRNGPLRLR